MINDSGMTIYDVSRPISPETAVWPGDRPFERTWTERIREGATVNLSAITLSPHTGTHADAPYHVDDAGRPTDALPLEAYLGPATVVELRGVDALTEDHLADLDLSAIERLLIRTATSDLDAETWPARFLTLTADVAERFGEEGVRLVGVDSPSVDPQESQTLDAHKTLARHGVVHLENLWLRDVPPGDYWLSALPLRLEGLDAAPVRAVLMTR